MPERPYTHKKRDYHAHCMQWDGANTDAVKSILVEYECEPCSVSGSDTVLMLRWRNKNHTGKRIDTLKVGDWIRIGENNSIKLMSNTDFTTDYVSLTTQEK